MKGKNARERHERELRPGAVWEAAAAMPPRIGMTDKAPGIYDPLGPV